MEMEDTMTSELEKTVARAAASEDGVTAESLADAALVGRETSMDLRRIVREAIHAIEGVGPEGLGPHVARVREALTERGLAANCNVGNAEMREGDDLCVEWYAGQLLDLVDCEGWFAMNSLINTLDKLVPAEAPGEG